MTIFFLFNSLFVISYILLIKRNKKKLGFVGGYSSFSFGLFLYYGIIPMLIICFKQEIIYKYSSINEFVYNSNDSDFAFAGLLIALAYLLFNLGYKVANKVSIFSVVKSAKFTEQDVNRNNMKFIQIISQFAVITFIIGGISLIIFIIGGGGLRYLLSIAETARQHDANIKDFGISPLVGLFIVLGRFITVSPIFYYYLIQNRSKQSDKTCFLITTMLSIIYFLYNAGRSPLLFFLLTFFYFLIRKRFKNAWLKIIIIAIFSLPLLDVLDKLFILANTQKWEPINVDYISYINQFSHPTKLILNVHEITDRYGFRYFKDLISDILGLLPKISFESSFYNTSEFIKGANWRALGGTPNDVITYGYIQLGILGVIIVLFMWGLIIGYIDKVLSIIPNKKGKDLISASLVLHVFQIPASADLLPILQQNVMLLFIIIIFITYSNFISRQSNNKLY